MPIELGLHSPRIERVRDLRTARGRRDQGRFSIEGSTLIAEALHSGTAIREMYASAEAMAHDPSLAAHEAPDRPLFTLPARLFARLSDLSSPPGILAVADIPSVDPRAILATPGTVLLLAGINDPGNAGTLLRSAEAFGATGVLFGEGGVDAYAPKVVRAAMGALFRLPVATVRSDWLELCAAEIGRPIVAADTAGSDVTTTALPIDLILAIGNERRGVHDWLSRFDLLVRIPQRETVESLNAGVAGSILLYLLSRPR